VSMDIGVTFTDIVSYDEVTGTYQPPVNEACDKRRPSAASARLANASAQASPQRLLN